MKYSNVWIVNKYLRRNNRYAQGPLIEIRKIIKENNK